MQRSGSVLPESAHTFDRIGGEPEAGQMNGKGLERVLKRDVFIPFAFILLPGTCGCRRRR
jgi:hypothetical protein